MHVHNISDLQFSFVIFNYNQYIYFVIQQLLSALFIYSFSYELFNCYIYPWGNLQN